MKQTAVEWLEQQLFNKRGKFNKSDIDQAKEMEKEQIVDAWDDGYDKGMRDRIEKISNPVGNAEQYYNETFKSE
jgi:hypothetical protein